MNQRSALSLLLQHIQDAADVGRWDLVERWISNGLQDHRDSQDPELRHLCFVATQWHLRNANDLPTLISALDSARSSLGDDLDAALDLRIGTTYLLLENRKSAGYVQVAGWLRGHDVARPDLALLVLEQAGRWDSRNPVVPVVEAAAHLDLGNLTDALMCLDRAEQLGATPDALHAVSLRLRRLTGEKVPEAEWEGVAFGPQGHREQGYAVLEHLQQRGQYKEALQLAQNLDSERSTMRSRHYLRSARKGADTAQSDSK